jgi:hypothetical protein
MEGWNSYATFEQDGEYANTNMTNWAIDYGYTVDPFIDDDFDGYMNP